MEKVVASTHQFESTVVKTTIGKLWESLRELKFNTLFPSTVTSVEYTEGKAGQLSSIVKIAYKDGSKWSYRVNEISDLNYFISFELVEADPKSPAGSVSNKIKLLRITEDNTTYLKWETDFSNDVDANAIQDNKFKKQDYFADLKKVFA